MKRKSSHGSRERVVLRARLRVRSRRARFSRVMPAVRTAVSLVLVVSLVISGWRWLIEVPQAGALEFTPHVVGESGSAVGVQGVAAYDIDGDGDRDIVTGGIDGIKIYANTGDFKFDLHVVSDKQSERVQIADLDGDGDGDILVNFKGDSPSVAWFKNNGDFEFSSQSLGGATGRDAVAAAGDINGDGAIDIITSGSSGDLSGPFVLRTWINNGSGTFSATVLNADSKVTAVAIGDLNHNGYKDIVTGGDDGLQRWDTSDGATWTRVDVDDSNANRTHIVVGDPENGSTWIATADDNVDELVLYKSGPTESSYTRYGRMVVANSIDAKTVATVDLNGDGNLDLLVADQDKNSVYWYENDGTGQFKSQQTIATNLQSVYGVAAADLDGDGDSDIVTADLQRGIVYAYERLRTKPSAMAPGEIVQSTTGSGAVQFTSEISDGDDDPTRIRVQYSVDGQHWYKPWLTKVTADNGSVDLVNKNGYQVGTVDHIDTDQNDSVKLTFTWDTKSTENTGGPISGDTAKVYLRIIPRDDRDVGLAAVSSGFRVDNAPPTGAGALRLVSIDPEKAVLSWNRATDSNTFVYKVYYGTDNTAVLELRSDVWDVNDDSDLDDTEATTTTITSLAADKYYTFKLVAEDNFGNIGAWPSVRGKTDGSTATVPVATPLSGATPTPSPTPATSAQVTGLPSITPTPAVSPKPAAPDLAPVLKNNRPPAVDAGPDQVVNPRALVILDGTASFDPDPGDTSTLNFSWRQLSGPAVKLMSDRTATASFSAGDENETYIFVLTARDLNGASASDTVTVATRSLPTEETVDFNIVKQETPPPQPVKEESALIRNILKPADLFLLFLTLGSMAILLAERLVQAINQRRNKKDDSVSLATGRMQPQGKVVHYRTNEPMAGVSVLVYDATGKLRATERTNAQGAFSTFFPVGQYTIGVKAEGFTFAPAGRSLAPAENIVYTGGKLTVKDANQPLSIVIPMKPTAAEVTSVRVSVLHIWQTVQRLGRLLSWPLFLAGALLNTALVFLALNWLYLVIEGLYILLVIVKIALEVRMRPAYGQVRDAITHIPLDLAVVRLFNQKTKRLVMTRVTNNQGKFFALPPAGSYMITVTKPGYANFAKENVQMKSEHDTTVQMTADLMPVTPQSGGLAAARAATV